MTDKRKKDMQEVSKLLHEGKSRNEIASITGHDKAWISRIIKEMREEAPELLEGTAEAAKEGHKKGKQEQKEPSDKLVEPSKAEKYASTQMLSFRANTDDLKRWKAYAQAKNITSTELYTAAINDYLEDNPLLTSDEAQLYELLLKRGL